MDRPCNSSKRIGLLQKEKSMHSIASKFIVKPGFHIIVTIVWIAVNYPSDPSDLLETCTNDPNDCKDQDRWDRALPQNREKAEGQLCGFQDGMKIQRMRQLWGTCKRG